MFLSVTSTEWDEALEALNRPSVLVEQHLTHAFHMLKIHRNFYVGNFRFSCQF